MSRERPANTKQTAKQGSPMPVKGSMKTVNTTNPTLHTGTGKAANISKGSKGMGTTGKTGGTQTGSGTTSSISLGQSRFDNNTHMLYADAKKGGLQIRCSITQDALCECFDVEATSNELQSAFTEHKGEILKALERKWLAGDWKTPNKEICLEETDIRRVIE